MLTQLSTQDTFTEKVVLITGAATGIGRATALAFASAGARVVLGDIDTRAAETVTAITDSGGSPGLSRGTLECQVARLVKLGLAGLVEDQTRRSPSQTVIALALRIDPG